MAGVGELEACLMDLPPDRMESSPPDRALVLADAGQRKLPPDRPPAEGQDERKKKKKLEEVPQAIMDEAMSDKETDQHFGEVHTDESSKAEDKKEQSVTKFSSYRDSLLGFNGIAHSDHILEEEDLFANDKEVFWKIPEPTEEMKKLMETYPVAPCTEEEYNEWCEPWNYALIITVLGKKFNLYVLKDLLIKMWGFSNFELIDIPNNYFVVRFQDQELWRSHYRKVLYEGPWVIRQHCVIVQRWSPYFNPYQNELGRVATWVRIPDVPMHLYNKHCISRLGDRIGRTLKVDMNTLQDGQNMAPKRGKFVRICVELNLQKKLVPKVIAAGSIFNVEYEGLTLICFACGRFGHRKEGCPHKGHVSERHEVDHAVHHPSKQPSTRLSVNTSVTNADEAFGPWMLVNRRTSRARPSQRSEPGSGPLGTVAAMASSSKPVSATVTAQKSRFAVIQDLELPDSALGVEDEISKDKVCFSVKPSNQGRKWETAGKVISKGAEYKNTKIQYKPKAKHAIGPMSVGLNVEKKGAATFEKHGQLDHDDGPTSDGLIVMEKGVKAKQESVPSFGLVTGPEISNGNLPLLCNSGVNEVLGKSDFLNSQNQQDNDSNATGGELISTAGQKLTPGRKSKSQRTHTVVFGSIGNVDRGKNKEEESLC